MDPPVLERRHKSCDAIDHESMLECGAKTPLPEQMHYGSKYLMQQHQFGAFIIILCFFGAIVLRGGEKFSDGLSGIKKWRRKRRLFLLHYKFVIKRVTCIHQCGCRL